jgi:hypothetical protein
MGHYHLTVDAEHEKGMVVVRSMEFDVQLKVEGYLLLYAPQARSVPHLG